MIGFFSSPTSMILFSFPAEDTVNPMLVTCQEDITFNVLTGMAPVPVFFTAPTAVDNSGNTNLILSTKSPGDEFNAGQTNVEYRFEDQARNTASCTFVVNIVEGKALSLISQGTVLLDYRLY